MSESELDSCKKKPTCKNTERAKLWAVRVLMIGSITYQAVRQKNMLNWTCGVKRGQRKSVPDVEQVHS